MVVEDLPDRVEALARAQAPRPDGRPSLALVQPPEPPRRRTWPETVAARAAGELDDATFQRLRLARQAARVSLADRAVAPDAFGELVDRIEAALDAAGVRSAERGGY